MAAEKKKQTEAHSFFSDNKWSTSPIKTLAWHNSETTCSLKWNFAQALNFYGKLCLKTNWNLDGVPLTTLNNIDLLV